MYEHVIETRALSKRFGSKYALQNLTLEVPRRGIHAIVGSNGAGKTTLFRVLLGILSPSAGNSSVLGVDSESLDPETRGRVGLVHEGHTLPGWMTVAGVTAMQRDLYSHWQEDVYKRVIGHFRVLPKQKISQLSRGERAGVNLAMALAQSPELLILDEPTLGLDVVAKQAFLECLLFAGEHNNSTIVYCSHQMDEIERVAENLIILEEGRLVSMSSPERFCDRISYWITDLPPAAGQEASIPGILQQRDMDGQRHLVVIDQDESFRSWLQAHGAEEVQRVPIGLDRAVNAYLTRNHVTPAN